MSCGKKQVRQLLRRETIIERVTPKGIVLMGGLRVVTKHGIEIARVNTGESFSYAGVSRSLGFQFISLANEKTVVEIHGPLCKCHEAGESLESKIIASVESLSTALALNRANDTSKAEKGRFIVSEMLSRSKSNVKKATQSELASIFGCVRETATNLIGAAKDAGLISIGENGYMLK